MKKDMEIIFNEENLGNLDLSLSKAILPVLKAFKEAHSQIYETSFDIDLIIKSFEIISNSNGEILSVSDEEIVQKGLTEFANNFRKLWI